MLFNNEFLPQRLKVQNKKYSSNLYCSKINDYTLKPFVQKMERAQNVTLKHPVTISESAMASHLNTEVYRNLQLIFTSVRKMSTIEIIHSLQK